MENSNYALQARVAVFTAHRASPAGARTHGIIARIVAYFKACARERAQRRLARESVRRLAALTTRELKDIGLSRSEIPSVIYGTMNERRVKYYAQV